MVREIMRDVFFLSQKSEPASAEDISVAKDLVDTLNANREACVGMAANMIGVRKRIIVFIDGDSAAPSVMLNPEIIKCAGAYDTEEGCLSLSGTRKTRRYRSIKVRYQNEAMQVRIKSYSGYTAQIIQHEIDHCNGIII